MRRLLLAFLSIVLFFGCQKEWDEMEHLYYRGDIVITDLAHIFKFEDTLSLGYNAVDGDITIIGNFDSDRLKFLNEIYEITGDIHTEQLAVVNIFENLREARDIKIYESEKLDDFGELVECRNLTISVSDEFNAFGELVECRSLTINGDFDKLIGFQKLEICDGIYVRSGIRVRSFTAFPLIENIRGSVNLHLRQDSRDDLNGFDNLIRVGAISLDSVGKNAFPKLKFIEDIYIYSIFGENSFIGLDSVGSIRIDSITDGLINFKKQNTTCESLRISRCHNMIDLQGISNLEISKYIILGWLDKLVSLDGLKTTNTLEEVGIYDNPSLINFCALADISVISYKAQRNKYNPTWNDIQNSNCLLLDTE